ncbi:hypothetical protein SISNIDRAFT_463433 [Sistotremastrum niveocremeum HHB9708]|uniref:F-box domain-containing protein n=1 Tax=Sistotremastrum niveocremeum HHB9708 TaxID=1314777 RepID=A0A164Y7P1_9AGAM|nr:hypothetical protein SISNIDRAFT_463433 [Sistotremastrum niveocremeum HHB9708]
MQTHNLQSQSYSITSYPTPTKPDIIPPHSHPSTKSHVHAYTFLGHDAIQRDSIRLSQNKNARLISWTKNKLRLSHVNHSSNRLFMWFGVLDGSGSLNPVPILSDVGFRNPGPGRRTSACNIIERQYLIRACTAAVATLSALDSRCPRSRRNGSNTLDNVLTANTESLASVLPMTGLDELLDAADSLHQGASTCQDCGVYTSQIRNTGLPLKIESNINCSSVIINPIPMMPSIRTDIASLPTEILLHIFKLYYRDFWDEFPKGTVKDLQWWLILGVCSRWRQIVIGTPYFWQKLWTHWHPEIINLFEIRSKSYPLTIQRSALGGLLFDYPNYDSKGAAAARLLKAHTSRIRTLELEWMDYGVDTRDSIYEFTRRSVADVTFPEVTQVFLSSCNHRRTTRSMKLNTPRLKVLILHELVLNSTSYPNLANLTYLRLKTCSLAAEDIVPLLEACPRLEYCDIRTGYAETPHIPPEPRLLSTYRVPMRVLEDLNISGLPWMFLARTLDRLEICPTANMKLQISLEGMPENHPRDALSRIVSPLISSYNSLEISRYAVTLKRSTKRGSLNLNPDDMYYLRCARPLEPLSYFSLPTIGIHLSSISIANIRPHHVPDVVDIWSAFLGFPNIEALSLRECKDINNFLLAFQHDATTVLCPRLRRLDLQGSYYEIQVLIKFVKERHPKDSIASIEWLHVVAGLFPEYEQLELRCGDLGRGTTNESPERKEFWKELQELRVAAAAGKVEA